MPRDTLVQALNALKDPQLRAMLATQSTACSNLEKHPTPPPPTKSEGDFQWASPNKISSCSVSTVIHKSPFALLGATTRDNRKRIVELAEEKSLELDHETCQKARSDLTNPRTRLSAEIAWLAGISPRRASQLVDTLSHNPMAIRAETGLPTLAQLNLLAATFEFVDESYEAADLVVFIQEFAELADELMPEDVLRDINEDRKVSGFPEVRGLDQIERELTDRKRYFRDAIMDALENLPTDALLKVMVDTVNEATASGEAQAPELLDELVDGYAIKVHEALQKQAENVRKLIEAARSTAATGELTTRPIIDELISVARIWDGIAQPIQLSAKARGIDHGPSDEIANSVRSLAIELFNEHDMLAQSQRLNEMIQELFAELPEVVERAGADSDALADISQHRQEARAIDPIRTLCDRTLKSIEHNPGVADLEGFHLLDEGRQWLEATSVDANSPEFKKAQNMLASVLMQCAVAYGNETSKWEACILLLVSAQKLESDVDLHQKLAENLAIVTANQTALGGLVPITAAPSLRTVNGIGLTLYGCTERNASNGSYMATYYFVFLAIPIFPIARYRVMPIDGGYRFLGKGSLREFDKLHIAISIGLISLGLIAMIFGN